jgi:hypothetical protein
MKRIPAVTEIRVIKPEIIILEVGDQVQCCDNSYCMGLSSDEQGYTTWTTNQYKQKGFALTHKKLTILVMNLKMPAMETFHLDQYRDPDCKPIFLDVIVKDEEGYIWATCMAFLRPIETWTK